MGQTYKIGSVVPQPAPEPKPKPDFRHVKPIAACFAVLTLTFGSAWGFRSVTDPRRAITGTWVQRTHEVSPATLDIMEYTTRYRFNADGTGEYEFEWFQELKTRWERDRECLLITFATEHGDSTERVPYRLSESGKFLALLAHSGGVFTKEEKR